jgi:transcriptional regulator with XRE-family HTH domain
MVVSRIGECLKAARERLGWSREALAFHSGVSWSAIAQIESGRRKDVRLSSLTALADALDISVDYLVGTAATTKPHLLEHRVLPYGSDEEFTSGAVPFLVEGIEQSHCVLALTTPPKTALLRETLGDRCEHVEFADWTDWYRSPQESLRRYGEFVTEKFKGGAIWIRVVAEAGWSDQSDAEIAAWTRYESIVNLAFASSPATIICTYDQREFSEQAIADACHTHPVIAGPAAVAASPTYRGPEDFLLDAPDWHPRHAPTRDTSTATDSSWVAGEPNTTPRTGATSL